MRKATRALFYRQLLHGNEEVAETLVMCQPKQTTSARRCPDAGVDTEALAMDFEGLMPKKPVLPASVLAEGRRRYFEKQKNVPIRGSSVTGGARIPLDPADRQAAAMLSRREPDGRDFT